MQWNTGHHLAEKTTTATSTVTAVSQQWLTFSTSVGTMDRRSVWPASLTILVNTTALFRDPSSRLLNRLFSLQQHKSCCVMILAPSLFYLCKSCYVMALPQSLFYLCKSCYVMIVPIYHHPYSICASCAVMSVPPFLFYLCKSCYVISPSLFYMCKSCYVMTVLPSQFGLSFTTSCTHSY